MPAPRSRRRARLAVLVSVALAFAGFQFFAAPAAQANVSSQVVVLPYTQNWSDGALITANDDWSGVRAPGYLGHDLAVATGRRPDADRRRWPTTPTSSPTDQPQHDTAGGVAESTDLQTIAHPGQRHRRRADLVFHLDTTGRPASRSPSTRRTSTAVRTTPSSRSRSSTASAGRAHYTNLPAGYIADATTAGTGDPGDPQGRRHCPAATDNQADVYVRVMTIRRDRHRRVDRHRQRRDRHRACGALADQPRRADQHGRATAISPLTSPRPVASTPYTYGATGLPAGLTLDPTSGQITGTPNTTAEAPSDGHRLGDRQRGLTRHDQRLRWTVNRRRRSSRRSRTSRARAPPRRSSGQVVSTQGVVTARYPTGGLNGFYIQTPGPDTADASDAIFVYGGAGGFGDATRRSATRST